MMRLWRSAPVASRALDAEEEDQGTRPLTRRARSRPIQTADPGGALHPGRRRRRGASADREEREAERRPEEPTIHHVMIPAPPTHPRLARSERHQASGAPVI